jgi:hypothetical protein
MGGKQGTLPPKHLSSLTQSCVYLLIYTFFALMLMWQIVGVDATSADPPRRHGPPRATSPAALNEKLDKKLAP